MSPLLRPEALRAIRRWREALAGLGLCLLGAYWLSGRGIIVWAGGGVALIGAALIVLGRERARFRREGEGPGIVGVDEGRLVYFGPETGGALAIRDLVAVDHDPARGGTWHLAAADGVRLAIPATAAGADALFDVFAALPGLSTGRLAEVARRREGPTVPVWRAARRRLH